MQLDPTDKSLLTVYVITVEKFVKSQIWQHGFTNILKYESTIWEKWNFLLQVRLLA